MKSKCQEMDPPKCKAEAARKPKKSRNDSNGTISTFIYFLGIYNGLRSSDSKIRPLHPTKRMENSANANALSLRRISLFGTPFSH